MKSESETWEKTDITNKTMVKMALQDFLFIKLKCRTLSIKQHLIPFKNERLVRLINENLNDCDNDNARDFRDNF